MRISATAVLSAAALALAAAPAAAAPEPGDLLVVDPLVDDAVIQVDPETGARTVVSDNAINTATDLFVEPVGIALAQDGSILVADSEASGGDGALIRVNPSTGQQSLVSDNALNTGTDLFENPTGVAVEADGDIVVSDNRSLTDDVIVRVDPATGQQALVSSNALNTGTDLFSLLADLALEADGDIVVADLDSLSPHTPGAVLLVDPASGQQSALSSDAVTTPSHFSEPYGVAVEADGTILVADTDTGLSGAIIRVNPATGAQSVVSDSTINTGTDLFGDPRGLALDAGNRIVLADSASGVIRVDPATGQQTGVSATAGFQPFDVLVLPGGFVPPPGGNPGGTPSVNPAPAAKPKRCKKGQKLKKGRCVKKKRKKKKGR